MITLEHSMKVRRTHFYISVGVDAAEIINKS